MLFSTSTQIQMSFSTIQMSFSANKENYKEYIDIDKDIYVKIDILTF